MIDRPRERASAFVVLLAFTLLPLGQTLHIALADHAHRYCAKHHRIEDVPDSAGPLDGDTVGKPSFRPPDTSAHAACAVLNADVWRKPILIAGQRVVSHATLAAPSSRLQLAPPRESSHLILLAPKNSPPRLTA
jgi:hypothetical protein